MTVIYSAVQNLQTPHSVRILHTVRRSSRAGTVHFTQRYRYPMYCLSCNVVRYSSTISRSVPARSKDFRRHPSAVWTQVDDTGQACARARTNRREGLPAARGDGDVLPVANACAWSHRSSHVDRVLACWIDRLRAAIEHREGDVAMNNWKRRAHTWVGCTSVSVSPDLCIVHKHILVREVFECRKLAVLLSVERPSR
jgi:hypothetical protein